MMHQNTITHDLTLSDEEIARQVKQPQGENGLAIMARHNIGNKFMVARTYEKLNPVGCRTLEVGFGNGVHFKDVFERYPGLELTGIEISSTMMEDCRKLNADLLQHYPLQIIHGDVMALPFEDDSFDKIATINTIYYWNDIQKGLQELFRVLKPGGTLAVSFRPYNTVKDISYFRFGLENLGFHAVEALGLRKQMEQQGFISVFYETEDDEMQFTDKNGRPFLLQSEYLLATK